MIGIGDAITFLSALGALIYGLRWMIRKKAALYFQMIIGAVGCHILGYLFDLCELFVNGALSEGFTIGYLGTIGCFLSLLTANFGCVDGMLDDRSPAMRKSRYLALLAPVTLVLLLVPNLLGDVPMETKISYVFVWVPAIFSAYFNLKHALIPDMGFGFVKAIRPFNVSALIFTVLQLLHLTLWNFFDWIPLMISGIVLGVACWIMVVMAKRGVERWVL